jgi:hypothetical protein
MTIGSRRAMRYPPPLRERAPWMIVEDTALERPGCPVTLCLFSSWRSAA